MKRKEFLDFKVEIKALDDSKGIFEGYGSIFDNVDSYRDIIQAGAFVDSLNKRGLPSLLWQHDSRKVIGKYIEAREDAKGLYVKGELNLEVQQGREAYALLKQGAISGLSIGFMTKKDEVTNAGIRLIKEVDLYEVSIVTFPANEEAQITATKGQPENIREFEKFLREVGDYSQSQAKLIASKGFRAYEQEQREVVEADEDEETKESLNQLLNKLKEL